MIATTVIPNFKNKDLNWEKKDSRDFLARLFGVRNLGKGEVYKKLDFDIWLNQNEGLIFKVKYNRLGRWEYRLKNYE